MLDISFFVNKIFNGDEDDDDKTVEIKVSSEIASFSPSETFSVFFSIVTVDSDLVLLSWSCLGVEICCWSNSSVFLIISASSAWRRNELSFNLSIISSSINFF